MAAYDLTMRYLAQEFPEDMAFLSLGLLVDEIKTLSPDLPAFEQRADWLARVRIRREAGILQAEFQTEYTEEKKEDMLGYRVQAKKVHRLPIFSVMVLLSKSRYPGPGHNVLEESTFGHSQLSFCYHEVRLWELDPKVIMKRGLIGLIPLVPLMKGRGREPLKKALAAASRVTDNVQRADVLTAVAVLGSLKYPKDLIKQLIRSEAMKESPIYQEILQEGRKKGRIEGRTEGRTQGRIEGVRILIGRSLQRRFATVPAQVKARLARIRSFERLEELAEHAVKCRNLATFSKLLD